MPIFLPDRSLCVMRGNTQCRCQEKVQPRLKQIHSSSLKRALRVARYKVWLKLCMLPKTSIPVAMPVINHGVVVGPLYGT